MQPRNGVLALVLLAMLTGCTRAPETGSPPPATKAAPFVPSPKVFPARVAQALAAPNEAELLSLEPAPEPGAHGPELQGRLILGAAKLSREEARVAIDSVKSAVADWDGAIAACFEPRHGLRLRSDGRVYEVLICYECRSLLIFEDGKQVADAGLTGSPDALNRLLRAKHIPLSRSGEEEDARMAAQRRKDEIAERRWREAMPAAVRPAWDAGDYLGGPEEDLRPLQAAMAREFPNRDARILALLAWYGGGRGPWNGYASYEDVVGRLLRNFSTPELVSAVQSAKLSEAQIEGAARLFAGWEFGHQRPQDRTRIPPGLRRRLLTHALKSDDPDKRERARQAFAG